MYKSSLTLISGRILIAFSLAVCAITQSSLVCAAPAKTQKAPVQSTLSHEPALTKSISLGVGKSIIVDLPRDASEIFVGNPQVANAIVRSARKLYIIAIAGGQTTIFASDQDGRQIGTIDISVGRDVQELDRLLKAAMPNSIINLRTVDDTIILSGTVESAGDAQKAYDIALGFVGGGAGGQQAGAAATGGAGAGASNSKVINSLTIRGRDQVMLKVTISEIKREIMKQLGITDAVARGSWGTILQQNPLGLNLQQLSNGVTKLGPIDKLTDLAGPFGIGAQLKAFERSGVARTLAEPTVSAVSGESAKFTAGGEMPVPTGQTCQAGACTTQIGFKSYGVTLNFEPVVLAEGRILLRVATEVTEMDPTNSINFSNTAASASVNVPGFLTRKNETSVELPSGGSIVSAGLIQSHSRAVINGFPGLMNLPVLGTLFRSRDYQRDETELLVIVTPYIVKPIAPSQIAKPTDGFSDPSDPQGLFLGRVNRIYSTTANPDMRPNYRGNVGFIND
ncbi:MAG: type II and III secretion system protein family protein [Methylocystaceae bacterium]|nr:type II and III secretion system protein family protein [Methylocystaceae bacterium]